MQIPTLIDNVNGNTLLKVLESLLVKSAKLDIATGTFEIGAFLSLGKTWQHLDGIRLLMGDETTVLLLCGGDKSSQARDIERAKDYWLQYKRTQQ